MIIKRSIYADIQAHLSEKEITLVIGPRQAGKTTILKELAKQIRNAGSNVLFLNLDIESEAQYVQTQEALLAKIRLEFGKQSGVVFIDEIQRKKNAGIFLKGLYDMDLPYKFVVSGSGSLELQEYIAESLTGRKRIFSVFPLSFEEFVNYKTANAYQNRLPDFLEIEEQRGRLLLSEYMNMGGYPRVVLAETAEEKRQTMNEIFSSYIEKDIVYLLHIKKAEAFTRLVALLASQNGQLLNITELSNSIQIAKQTVEQYLWYLEKTFVIQRVTPYFQNKRKEILKAPIACFIDTGMRAFANGAFGQHEQLSTVGFVFQSIVYGFLRDELRNTSTRFHFWRTTERAEVDLILVHGAHLLPIEIKYSTYTQPTIPRSLRQFIARYHPAHAFIINLNFQHSVHINSTTVHFVPFFHCYSDQFTRLIRDSVHL